MRYYKTLLAMGLALLAMPTALAQEEQNDLPGREMRERLREEYDANGDGQLDEQERAAAREAMAGERGGRGPANRQRGPRDGRPGQGRQRGGDEASGPGGPGQVGPGQFARLFDRFDENGDGQLSREEFMQLGGALQELGERGGRRGPADGAFGRRQQGPPNADQPPRPEGRPEGRRGGTREGRRSLDASDEPLQNSVPPAGPEFGRRRGPDGAPPEEARGGRPGGPNPERLFARFDENGDQQLSHDEFMRMEEFRATLQSPQMGRGGMRGQGDRLGPPPGDSDRPGPRRGRRGGPQSPPEERNPDEAF